MYSYIAHRTARQFSHLSANECSRAMVPYLVDYYNEKGQKIDKQNTILVLSENGMHDDLQAINCQRMH